MQRRTKAFFGYFPSAPFSVSLRPLHSALHFPLTNHSLPSTCSAACVLDSCRIPSNGYHHCSCIRLSRASSTPSLSSLTSLQFKFFISARNRTHHPPSSTIAQIQRPLAEASLPSFNLQPGASGAQQERQQQERGATAHHKHAAATRCNLFINELHCVQQLRNASERHSKDIHRMQLLAHVTYTTARSACTLTHCRG